jgi:hypothetical protein
MKVFAWAIPIWPIGKPWLPEPPKGNREGDDGMGMITGRGSL